MQNLYGKLGAVVSPEGIDHGKARPQAEAVWQISSGQTNSSRGKKLVSQNFASWNRISELLRQLSELCSAA